MPAWPSLRASTTTKVVASHSNVPSASRAGVGMRNALTSIRSTRIATFPWSELVNLVPEEREADALLVRLSSHEGLREMRRLLRPHARRHRRLEPVDDHFGERRSIGRQQLAQCVTDVLGFVAPQSDAAARLRELHEVDGVELHPVLRIPE